MRNAKSTIQTATMKAKNAASLLEKFFANLLTAYVAAVAKEAATAQSEAVPRPLAAESSGSLTSAVIGWRSTAAADRRVVLIVVVAVTTSLLFGILSDKCHR